MPRINNEPKLNPNSEYHAILIKEYGRQGAIAVLKTSRLAYSFDTVNHMRLRQYRLTTWPR